MFPVIACGLGLAALIVGSVAVPGAQTRLRDASLRLETASLDDLPSIEADAKRALGRSPLEARALSLLAMAAERTDQEARARDLMRGAAKLSRRDGTVDAWLFNQAVRNRQYSEAFVHADAIMRRRGDSLAALFSPILAVLSDPQAIEPLAKRMVYGPDWRRQFLAYVSERSPDTAFALMSATRRLGGPPTSGELSNYLNAMVRDQRYREAHAHWQVLRGSPVQGAPAVSDGDFSGAGSTPPFGWSFEGNVFGSIERAEAYGREETALRVDYDGSSQARFPQQLVVLSPGAHRLSGDILTVTRESAGALRWTISCVDGAELASAPAVDTQVSWRRFTADFEVPADGCDAQLLVLKGKRGDRRSTIEVWYDKLAINPLGAR